MLGSGDNFLFQFSVELKLTFALLLLEVTRVSRPVARVSRQTSSVCMQRVITVLITCSASRVLIVVPAD
jgi:hypothetical protein